MKIFSTIFLQIFLAIATCLVGFFSIEIYFRFIKPQPAPIGILSVFKAIYPDSPTQIWELRPNHKEIHQREDFKVTIETNALGFRLPTPDSIDNIDMLVMGDSFTFGYGIEGNERYGYLLGKKAGLKTLVTGYNNGITTPHYYKYFLLNENLKPKHIVVGLFLGNDLSIDMNRTVIEQNDPFEMKTSYHWADAQGRLRYKNVLKYDILETLNEHSIFITTLLNHIINIKSIESLIKYLIHKEMLPNSKATIDLANGIPTIQSELAMDFLLRLTEECQARNPVCNVYALIIPEKFFVQDIIPDASQKIKVIKERIINGKSTVLTYALEACEKRKLNCLNPTEALQKEYINGTPMYFEFDGHWTPAANTLMADFLCENVKGLTCYSKGSFR